MSQLQKTIKYLAIAFALFLLISIISGIMYGFSFLGDIFVKNNQNNTKNLESLEYDQNVLTLDINVASSNISFKKGDAFKVQTNNKYIDSYQEENKLYLTERKNSMFHHKENNELVVYIPNDLIFDKIEIESGAGKMAIEKLSTKQLYLDLGAGKVTINDLTVLEKAKIDGGVGEITIKSSNIHNLDLDMGIGKLFLNSQLRGNNKIDSGVGKMNLLLLGSLSDYSITLNKGLGSSTINHKNMSEDTIYGTGENNLLIDGGIGSIQIDFRES